MFEEVLRVHVWVFVVVAMVFWFEDHVVTR